MKKVLFSSCELRVVYILYTRFQRDELSIHSTSPITQVERTTMIQSRSSNNGYPNGSFAGRQFFSSLF
jgi:hypothetical protein